MATTDRIEEAITDLDTQEEPNYAATARKYNIDRLTLWRRHKGICRSRQEFLAESCQCLNTEQEEILIKQINYLSARGLPPTSQIVKNMAEAIIGKEVGKNWTGRFVQRHERELKSLYLRNIDKNRVKGEYGPVFKLFYDLVSLYFLIVLVFCLLKTNLLTDLPILYLVRKGCRETQYYCRKPL